ncbi:MAG: helicase-related protein [Allopontixanthobacter sp.]|nr:helicase-related protein [Allopontixanthobacter sp.]MDZ4308459.1 helicase-related protein [Allopontixanthobacter sp.]
MCGHSSGAIGFPLRLLAREVYDRVVRIKGAAQVALITGEERIEPPGARYYCCTAEAMPAQRTHDGGTHSFLALDEAQLGANRERGHIFTDRLLNARGRDETMLLGAATLEPMVRALHPDAEIIRRPRFSTLTHIGPRKLSRLPPRSAIVAFSAEQVYAVAEMLRRFRGGSAVVMGALSPETRNRQVELFQSGEVDYIVATDAIGMGLNLDINHVAFASLTKYDGVRKRRLMPAEMAQIAGRAGRHQRDGTFGALSGIGRDGRHDGEPVEFTEEEIYAIEEHRFAPLTQLYWRDSQPRFDTLAGLIGDLESPPENPALTLAPEAIDLAVLKRLVDEPWADQIKGPGNVRRFWEACSLPDFRQHGTETHSRFVARLWQDLQQGHIGADYAASRISELDNMQGDIHALQGRIAAIRSWAYICQRPDWVLARDEMAARAHAVEAKLSDALHGRLTERFVNRRTAILMKSMGQDASLLAVSLSDDGVLSVEDEPIGRVEGLRFSVDHGTSHADRKMLLAAGEKAMPRILSDKVDALLAADLAGVELKDGAIWWEGQRIAELSAGPSAASARLVPDRQLNQLPDGARLKLVAALEAWLAARMAPLAPLAKLEEASRDPAAGSEARALLLSLIAGHGHLTRQAAGLEHLPKETRPFLRRIGVTFGALDIFAAALLKPAPRQLLNQLGADPRPLNQSMIPVIDSAGGLPTGYRHAGKQAVRIDIAEKIIRAAHDARSRSTRRRFILDPALAVSTGLTADSYVHLLGQAGFRRNPGRALAEGAMGPPAPDQWEWHPSRGQVARRPQESSNPRNKKPRSAPAKPHERTGPPPRKPAKPAVTRPAVNPNSAFAGLADLLR